MLSSFKLSRLHRRLHIILVVLISFVLCQCGLSTGKAPKVKYPNKLTPEMELAYNQAERDFQSKNYGVAASGFQAYLQQFPYNRLSDQSQYRLGQLAMLKKQYAKATGIFGELIQKTPDPAVASRARVKAGISQYRLKRYSQALNYFNRVEGQYIRGHDKIKVGGLALKILAKQKASVEAKAYYWAILLDGYQGLSPAELKKRYRGEAPAPAQVKNDLATWARSEAPLSQIDPRFLNYRPQASARYVNFKLGQAYYAAGDNKKAKKYLSQVASSYPGTPMGQKAQALLTQLGYKGKKTKVKGLKVGLILPLTGKYAGFGQATFQGMECAAGLKAPCSQRAPVVLVVRDDAGNPAKAAQAVETLVNVEKVDVIVGPLSSASALAAASKAQELGVVMISLAQKEGIPQVGSNIFRFSLTPDQQVRALLAYATKKLKKKDIGVLYPKNKYGEVFLAKSKESAPNYGASVSGQAGYAKSGQAQGDIRNLKFSVSKSTPTVPLGFNAIFIPDSYRAVLNLLVQLAQAGLGEMPLLGTNAWNDPKIAQGAGDQLSNAVFLDIYFKNSKRPQVRQFVSEYSQAYGQAPTTLEAMGYDIVRFLGEMALRSKVKGRAQVRPALVSMSGFEGVTGLRAFASSREARLKPYMLTVKQGRIQEVGK